MSLTIGTGPFGQQSAGEFNFTRQGPERVIYWESFPKRFRVQIGSAIVADSRHAHLLHEQGHLPRVYLPRQDVLLDRLVKSDHRSHCPWKGEARYWSALGAQNIAWSYEQPIEGAPPFGDHVSFDLDRVDAWYEEDEKGYAHPRDPYHRVDVCRTSRRVVIRCGGIVLAEAEQPAMLFETALAPRFYLPPDAVQMARFEKSDTVSPCPYKGPGQHWHLVLDDLRIEDAAWTLSGPIGDATAISDWWSFYTDKLEVEVDGKQLVAD